MAIATKMYTVAHMNLRILPSGAKAQEKMDFQKPWFVESLCHVVFGDPDDLAAPDTEPETVEDRNGGVGGGRRRALLETSDLPIPKLPG